MPRRVIAAFVLGLFCLVGCSGGKNAPPKLVDVKGAVTLDGKPMPEGDIRFIVDGQPPKSLPIKGGSYSGKVFVGKNRIEIVAYKAAPPSSSGLSTDDQNQKINYLPDRYNTQSTLTAEVASSGANDFPFTVTSR